MFTADSDGERKLKIGPHLAKLWTRLGMSFFYSRGSYHSVIYKAGKFHYIMYRIDKITLFLVMVT